MNKRMTFMVALVVLMMAAVWPPAAAAAPGPPATRIRFQPGATSRAVTGQLAARGTRSYVLRASAGQIMQVALWSNGAARILVRRADGAVLSQGSAQGQGWQGRLPQTGDYLVQVAALDQAISYCLRVTIFARIQFTRGAASATVSSPVQYCLPRGPDVVGGYVLRALAGQTMRVTIDSPNHNIHLTIKGADGVTLKSYDDRSADWEGALPSTQDYYLLPIAMGSDARFTLTVWISPLGQVTSPSRIRFASGATSGTVSGHLSPGGKARYVLWAARGQRMALRIWPAPSAPLPVMDVTVMGPDGRVWRGLQLDTAIDPLPLSGDYVLTLALRPGSGGANYSMEVTIPAS
jgi:hypothetical protein